MVREAVRRLRIIPAYAGSTYTCSKLRRLVDGSSPHTRGAPPSVHRASLGWPDHPRIRGEHASERGAQLHEVRIIPAYAGST